MNYINQQVAKSRLDTADSVASQAGADFNKTQEDTKEQGVQVAEKIAFYSGGIISLTITFLGYILSNQNSRQILTPRLMGMPLYYYLYISLIIFIATILFGLFARRFDAFYTFYAAYVHFIKKSKTREEKVLEMIYSGYPLVGDTPEELEKKTKKNINIYDTQLPLNKGHMDRSFKFKMACLNGATIGFVLGIMLLSIFALNVLQRLITY